MEPAPARCWRRTARAGVTRAGGAWQLPPAKWVRTEARARGARAPHALPRRAQAKRISASDKRVVSASNFVDISGDGVADYVMPMSGVAYWVQGYAHAG